MAKKRKGNFRGKVKQDVERQKSRASGFGYLKLPKGVSLFKEDPDSRANLDLMPYEVTDENHPDRNDELDIAVPGSLWYKRPFKTHRNIGPNNETIVCPASIGKRCPICEYRAKGFKENLDPEELKALKPSLRNLYIVIPVKSKDYEEEPHIWDISQYLFQEKLNKELEEDEEFETFPDLEEGYTLRIRFDEESIGKNKFAEVGRIDFKERKEVYDESILDDIPNLDEVLNILTYKQIENLFLELDDEDITEDDAPFEDDEDEAPKKSRKKKRIKKEPEPEEDDDEPEDDPEDDDEPEETPKKTRKRKTRKKPEPEPEPEDDEDEDEPEKKRTSRKRRTSKSSKNKCPFDHEFGVDTDDFEDCIECKIWDECIDEKEKKEE